MMKILYSFVISLAFSAPANATNQSSFPSQSITEWQDATRSVTSQLSSWTENASDLQAYSKSLQADRAKELIDCNSYSMHHSTAIDSSALAMNVSSSAGIPSFEEFWCQNYADLLDVTPDSGFGQVLPYFWDLNETTKNYCLSLQKAQYTSFINQLPTALPYASELLTDWGPVVTPPCCDDVCQMRVSGAQLLYWPTPATFPNVTTIIENGFTFTSPSIYIVFSDVVAYREKGCGTTGPSYSKLTLAYEPSEVTTVRDFGGGGPVNCADLFSNCTTQNIDEGLPNPTCDDWKDPSCSASFAAYVSSVDYVQKHCYPSLVYPSTLNRVDPAWYSCNDQNHFGYIEYIYDPPRHLTPVAAMAPAQTQISSQSESTRAAPASTHTTSAPRKTDPPSGTPTLHESAHPDPSYDPGVVDPKTGLESNGSPVVAGKPRPPSTTVDHSESAGLDLPSDPHVADPQASHESRKSSTASASTTPDLLPGLGHESVNLPLMTLPKFPPWVASSATSVPDPPVSYVHFAHPITATINGHIIEAAQSNSFVSVDGQSVERGGSSVMLSGTPMALDSNSDLVFGTKTIANLQTWFSKERFPIITAAGNIMTVSSKHLIVGGSTIDVHSHGITIDGTFVSIASSGVKIGSSFIQFPTPSSLKSTEVNTRSETGPISLISNNPVLGSSTIYLSSLEPGAIITAAGQRLTVPHKNLIIDGTTLVYGASAISIASNAISLGSDGVVVGTSTVPITSLSSITVHGHTYAVVQASGGVAAGGMTFSASQTSMSSSSSTDLGGLIISAFNGGHAMPTTPSEIGGDGSNTTGAVVSPIIFGGGTAGARMRKSIAVNTMVAILTLCFLEA